MLTITCGRGIDDVPVAFDSTIGTERLLESELSVLMADAVEQFASLLLQSVPEFAIEKCAKNANEKRSKAGENRRNLLILIEAFRYSMFIYNSLFSIHSKELFALPGQTGSMKRVQINFDIQRIPPMTKYGAISVLEA